VFVERNYEELESKPEWGLNISHRNMSALEEFRLESSGERLERCTAPGRKRRTFPVRCFLTLAEEDNYAGIS